MQKTKPPFDKIYQHLPKIITMKHVLFLLLIAFGMLFANCKSDKPEVQTTSPDGRTLQFHAHNGTPLVDGFGSDSAWANAEWLPLDQLWIGKQPTNDDYSGRYKLLWDENNLYILAEITDDTLIDIQTDGLTRYWDDDCLEIFLDEDASGGNHQYNYNAFAYHIALDGRVVDVAPDSSFQYFDDHCYTRRQCQGKVCIWEVAVKLYDGKQYTDDGENIPKMLKVGKRIGFALAYCDNDYSAERENFMGNVVVEGEDKNRGWIDAGIFGLLELQ